MRSRFVVRVAAAAALAATSLSTACAAPHAPQRASSPPPVVDPVDTAEDTGTGATRR